MGTQDRDAAYAFTGYVDDIRIWNKWLGNDEDKTNYDRILGGSEAGLVAYWTMDENLDYNVFDYSSTGNVANMNNPEVALEMKSGANTPQSLGVYGLTDSNGNYIIRGIPYASAGTNYVVRPQFGVHAFSPAHRTAFLTNQTSTSGATDFSDVSSFPVSGTVVYEGTNYPVEGAMLMVDGNFCTVEGKTVKTDEFGKFEISVPIGEHSVGVSLTNHTFVNNGRYPANGLFEFKKPVTGLTFEDATTVVLTGRVTGGNVEGKKPVGFGLSKNTIGEAEITLKASDLYYINAKWNGTRYEAVDTLREVKSSTPDICSKAYRGKGVDGAHRIYVNTDPQTGEFSAVVPPLKYTVEKISLPKNSDVTFNDIPKDIDLSEVGVEYKDSIKVEQEPGDSIMLYYPYQHKMLQTYLDPKPKLVITQVDKDESAKYGAFGMKSFEKKDLKVDNLWSWNAEGDSLKYLLGYPIFRQGERYEFQVEAYDEYVNRDGKEPEFTRVAQSGVKVTVSNPMSSEQTVIGKSDDSDVDAGEIYRLKENEMILDKNGKGTISWRAGFPNVTSPFTRSINVSGEFNGKVISAPTITGIIVGSLPKGNNFVTQGPDRIVTVLRDPPAAASMSSIQNDTITSFERMDASYSAFNQTSEAEFAFGLKTDVVTGFVLLDSSESINSVYSDEELENKRASAKSSVVTTTISKTISTSDDPEYVGSNGDVFIGYSTNLIVGDSRNLTIVTDSVNGGYKLFDFDGIVMDQTFKTSFQYSQLEIETKQIPTWEKLRNSLLLRSPHASSAEEAEKMKNTGKTPIYVTWLNPGDEDFGEDNTYVCIEPENSSDVFCDSVNYMNQQIRSWKEYLKENEHDKVVAFTNRNDYFMENFSFDGGSSLTKSYTTQRDSTWQDSHEFTFKMLGGTRVGYTWNKVGFVLKGMFGGGKGSSWEETTTKSYSQTYSYTLLDGNAYTDMTVDVYRSPAGWGPIFRVRGGQTCCPWEREERTRYFEPGNSSDSHILNYGTQAIDKPKIYCDERTRNDVLAGNPATFKLKLVNESEASLENTYILRVVDASNPHGAVISVDGVPLNGGMSINFGDGQVIEKTLTVSQTDMSVGKLERLGVALLSSCQNDPASYFGAVGDTIYLSVNYIPTSSDVQLSVPFTTVNTATGTKLPLSISGFDRSFKNLYGLRLQYRYGGASQWNTIHEYVLNPADSVQQSQSVIPKEGAITYPLDMTNFAVWPDGNYTLRAISIVKNGNEEVTKSSPEIALVKDTERPRPLGYPSPKNGILGIGDDISVTFNEDILKGQLTDNNVVVSGVLNEQAVAHGVAAKLAGKPIVTEGEYNLSNCEFSTEMWLYRTSAGEILRHGYGGNEFVASVDADGHLVVKVSGSTLSSEGIVPANKWVFLKTSFDNAKNHTMNASVAYDTEKLTLFDNVTVPEYSGRSQLVIGNGLKGMVNEVALWNYVRSDDESFEEMNSSKAKKSYGLVGYWKFNEGHGRLAEDATGRNDFLMESESWYLDNENLAAKLDGTQHIDIPVANVSTLSKDSYALEMWLKTDKVQSDDDMTIFQIGCDEDSLLSAYIDKVDGAVHIVHNKMEDDFMTPTEINDGAWHHFALNVRRGISAVCMVDGNIVGTIDERTVPAFAAAAMHVGASVSQQRDALGNVTAESYGKFLEGAVDEIKLWNADLNGSVIAERRFERVDASGANGLVAYYPFESLSQDEYHQWKAAFSLNDMCKDSKNVAVAQGVAAQTDAPAMQMASRRTVLNTSFTASERNVFITINNALKDYNGTTLDFEVSDVRDYNGNVSQPVKWSAFVDLNPLKWEKSEVAHTQAAGEETDFSVNISNEGGEMQNFYISNLPSWLTVDDWNGRLEPRKSLAVKFEVNSGLSVGQHDQTVYLVGNSGVCEPLHIVVKVAAQAPAWSVDAAAYEQSMNMVAQVYVNKRIVTNSESVLAAFVDGKCVGVASPKYMPSRDAYFTSMTVYGNAGDARKDIELRFWDASTGITYTKMTADRSLQFAASEIVGNFNSPVRVENSAEYEQTVELGNGWNWISTYLQPADSGVNAVMGSVADVLSVVKSESAFAMPSGGKLEGSLSSIEPKRMYAVNANAKGSFHVYGSMLSGSDLDVDVRSGWTWIGSTSPNILSLDEAFVGLSPEDGDVVKSQNAFAIYSYGSWEGNLGQILPGLGYKYLNTAQETKTFRFQQSAAPRFAAPYRAAGEQERTHFFNPVAVGKYSDNMTIVAQIRDRAQIVDTFELAAFVGDECRASSFAVNGKYFMVVPGDADGGTVRFKTVVDGKVTEFPNEVDYRSDSMVGSPDSPYMLDLDKASSVSAVGGDASGVSIAPQTTERFVGVRADRRISGIYVYDLHGNLSLSLAPNAAAADVDLLSLPLGNYVMRVVMSDGTSLAVHITKRK